MERIKQAIEKVKKQNQNAGLTTLGGKRKPDNIASNDLADYAYTNTKTVELDPAYLEKK